MESIKKNYEFRNVYKKGRFIVARYLKVYITSNKYDINRFGIVVSKKVGKAVKRNRIRRWIKENIRKNDIFINKGYDIVIVVRKSKDSEDKYSYNKIRKDLFYAFKKLSLMYDGKKKERVK